MADAGSQSFSNSWFEFTRAIRKRWWTVKVFLVTTVVVVVIGSWLQTPIYRATASVLIDMETPSVLAVSTSKDESTVSQINYLTYADYYRTQLEIITSRSLAERVFRNLKLSEGPDYRRRPDPVAALLKQVKVEPVKQTRLVKIHVEDKSPDQAARIVNEFATLFALENLSRTSTTEYLTLKKNEYLKLQAKEAELSKRYHEKHPAMVRIRSEMEQLEQSIRKETNRQTAYESEVQSPGSSPSDQETGVLAANVLRPNNIRVQDLAQPPLNPAKPNKVLNLFLGLCFGLLGGVGMAVVQEQLDTSLRGPEDIEREGSLVLLGHVPKIESGKGSPSTEFQEHWRFSDVEGFSPAAEAYSAIRTTLLYALPPDRGRAIAFTSPGPGEGKTTTVSNLGVAVARTGVKILLVDMDLRKGRLHGVFNLKRTPGMSEFLTGQASFEQIVRKTEVEGLFLVSCGVYPPHPAELIGSPQMAKFVDLAVEKFERVFIDTPPILAVTDAAIIAGKIKTVVAVAQSGKTPRQALLRLSGVCREVHAKLLGVILNNVAVWSVPYYYRYASYGYRSQQESTGDLGTTIPRPSSRPT